MTELARQKCPEERDKTKKMSISLLKKKLRMVLRRFISRKSGIPSSIFMGEKRGKKNVVSYYFEVCE